MTAVFDTPAMLEKERARRETLARRKRLRRRARGCGVWLVGIAIVGGLGTWLLVTVFLYADQRTGERALADARASGAPLTLTELTALSPTGPEIRRATDLWREAMHHVDLSLFSNRDFLKVPVIGANRMEGGRNPPLRDDRGRLRSPDLEDAKAFVSQFDKALDAARAARDAGGVANFAQADGGVSGYYQPYFIVNLASLLRLRTETRLASGDVEGAVDDLTTLVAVTDAMRYEPYDWQQRGRHQTLDEAIDLVERMLAVEELNDDQLRRLGEAFARRDETVSFRLALAGSRFQFVELLQRDDQAVQGRLGLARSPWTRGSDLAKGLDIYRRMDEASEQGLLEAIDAWKPIEGELSSLGAEPGAQVRYPGTMMLLPMLGQQAQTHLEAEARVLLAKTAIGCERYRLANGELPKKLDDLVPEFLDEAPLDPGDGKPLRYLQDASGVRLYSIGHDRVDQGGGAPAGSGAAVFAPSDVAFRLKKSRASEEAAAP